eukprot:6180390-Pleurochrysis_carterae.AAC.2
MDLEGVLGWRGANWLRHRVAVSRRSHSLGPESPPNPAHSGMARALTTGMIALLIACTSAFQPQHAGLRTSQIRSVSATARPSRPVVAVAEPATKPVASPSLPSFEEVFPQGKYLWDRLTRGPKRMAVVTGASSGLGKSATRSLIESGKWHVVMACRDVQKAKAVAEELGCAHGRLMRSCARSRARLSPIRICGTHPCCMW